MNNPLISSTIDRSFKHCNLYQFWWRSQGLWLSKLAKVTLRFLDEQELQTFQQIHTLEQPEFGVRMAWEYQTKSEVGQMMWCVDDSRRLRELRTGGKLVKRLWENRFSA